MSNATLGAALDPLRGKCPAPFYDVKSFGLDGCTFPLWIINDLANKSSCGWTILCTG